MEPEINPWHMRSFRGCFLGFIVFVSFEAEPLFAHFKLQVSLDISERILEAGQPFTLETTVHNPQSDPVPMEWNLHYYRSTDATIDKTDVLIHVDAWSLTDLAPSATQTVSLAWRAPPYPGTYYYGACIEFTNCSIGVPVTVAGTEGGSPDLVVHRPTVSHYSVSPGSQFSFRVQVENTGTGPAAATTVGFYRSDDATIDTADTQLHVNGLARLDAGASFPYTYFWSVPIAEATHYYALCVQSALGETNMGNNCSPVVPIVVGASAEGSPDLTVVAPSTLDYRPTTGEFFLWATVRNIGSGLSAETTLRYYRSNDVTIDPSDAEVRTRYIGPLSAEGLSGMPPVYFPENRSNVATAPASPGTYYYGACVDPVAGESDTGNNCSEAVAMNVAVPDLAVGSAWASTSVPLVAQSFTLTATVRNQGTVQAGSTTLRYYRSTDATIDATDTPIGTNAVSSLTGFDGLVSGLGSRLATSGKSRESISVSAPSSPGNFYYGACVDGVPGETNTDNNCSTGLFVRVVPAWMDPFNIELVFVGDFTDARKDAMQQAARHWETIITEGLPDQDFSADPHTVPDLASESIVVNDTVDDLRVFVDKDLAPSTLVAGYGGPSYFRSDDSSGLPAIGRIWIAARFLARRQDHEPVWREERLLRDLMLHELAHVLGFGPRWQESGLLHEFSGDTYFGGEGAIEAFNAAGGKDYRGNKVPVQLGRAGSCGAVSHWRPDVFLGYSRQFGSELMEPWLEREHRLSAITLQSLADLGYVIDVSRADPYTLPASVATAQPPADSDL